MIISAYSPATCKGCQDFLDSSSNSGKRDSDVWCHRSGEWSCLLPWAWIMDGRAEYSDSLSFSEWVQAEELERERATAFLQTEPALWVTSWLAEEPGKLF